MKMTIVLAVLLCVNAARAGVAAPGPGEIPGNLPLPTFQFSASLSGTNEVPPNSSSATGTVTFTLVANLFTYQVFLPLPLVPVGARIHGPANPGQNAGAVFDLDGPRFVGPDPGTGVAGYAFTGNRSLSGEEVAQLIAGFWYVNVRSAGFPDGELRGQIVLPGPDNDGDGVPDAADKCADQPETKNGFQDDDGCPDEIPEKLKAFTGVIQGITFKVSAADLQPASAKVLDKAIAVLAEFKDIKLEIQGHTDDQPLKGSKVYADNQALSQARAESVKAYFVSKGIEEGRLIAKGFGDTVPVESPVGLKAGKLASARAKNRRVEFKLVAAEGAAVPPPATPEPAPAPKE